MRTITTLLSLTAVLLLGAPLLAGCERPEDTTMQENKLFQPTASSGYRVATFSMG